MKKLPLCFICRTEPCRSPVASVCSLKCACVLNGDDYELIMANLRIEILAAKSAMSGNL